MNATDGRSAFFRSGELRVKICGVTNAADANLVVEAGADAIGVNLFSGSKRFVELDQAGDWVGNVPITRIAVVVNATAGDLARIAASELFDAIQFHGDELPEFCATSPLPWIRAVRVSGRDSLSAALGYATPTLLLDAHAAAGYGGTGIAVDPELAAAFTRTQPDRQVILAGGLRPESVAEAVRAVRPHGVDVASGVEMSGDARRKDPARVCTFVKAAREGLR